MTKSPAGVLGIASFRCKEVTVSAKQKSAKCGEVKLSLLLTCEMKSLQ